VELYHSERIATAAVMRLAFERFCRLSGVLFFFPGVVITKERARELKSLKRVGDSSV
jgi:hypothetical protein